MLTKLKGMTQELIRDEKGQGMAEYGIIIAVIAVVAIAAFTKMGKGVKSKVEEATDALE